MSLELLVISVVSVIFLFIILFVEVNMPLTVLNLMILKLFALIMTIINIPFYYSFRGSKYAAYRLKPDDSKVIRLDNDYYVISATLYLMIRRYLVALRKGDGSVEALFHL
nr:MAG TPA: hypothetical protein [Microviridae sp.]